MLDLLRPQFEYVEYSHFVDKFGDIIGVVDDVLADFAPLNVFLPVLGLDLLFFLFFVILLCLLLDNNTLGLLLGAGLLDSLE